MTSLDLIPFGAAAQRAVERQWLAAVRDHALPGGVRTAVRSSWERSLGAAVPPDLREAPVVSGRARRAGPPARPRSPRPGPICRFCCWASRARARSCSPRRFTRQGAGGTGRFSPPTARRCPADRSMRQGRGLSSSPSWATCRPRPGHGTLRAPAQACGRPGIAREICRGPLDRCRTRRYGRTSPSRRASAPSIPFVWRYPRGYH